MAGSTARSGWYRRTAGLSVIYVAVTGLSVVVGLLVGASLEHAVVGGTVVGGWLACVLFSGVELFAPTAFLKWRESSMAGAPDYAVLAAKATDRYVFAKQANTGRVALSRVRINGLVLATVATLVSALVWLIFVWTGLL